MSEKIVWMIPAEPNWKALYGREGAEFARSRVIGWAAVGTAAKQEIVGIVVDPADPKRLVPAPDVVDPSGGELMRYGYAAGEGAAGGSIF